MLAPTDRSAAADCCQECVLRPHYRVWLDTVCSLVVASLDKMLHDDYLCLVESGKQQIKKVRRKFKRKTWKQRQLLSESGFVLRIAPPSLSRDRRIKTKKSSIIKAGQIPSRALCCPCLHYDYGNLVGCCITECIKKLLFTIQYS